jgi:hypothetical protein
MQQIPKVIHTPEPDAPSDESQRQFLHSSTQFIGLTVFFLLDRSVSHEHHDKPRLSENSYF